MGIVSRLLRRRGTGCRLVDGKLPAWKLGSPDFDTLGLSDSLLPAGVDLTKYHTEVLDQGSANSCVWEAIAAAVDIAETRSGLPYVPVSSYFGYYYTRWFGRMLTDGGCFPSDAMHVLRKIGVCDYQLWPRNYRKINKQPGPDAYMGAEPRRGGKYVVIYDPPGYRTKAIRSAMASGYPVLVPLLVDRAFQQDVGPAVIGPTTGPVIGGHMQCLGGYRFRDQWQFRDINSYGTGWRDGGYAWITEEFVESPYCGNPIIIYGWERIDQRATTAGLRA